MGSMFAVVPFILFSVSGLFISFGFILQRQSKIFNI